MQAITIVLASQRSGSTLLCRDIESLGNLGAPGEHFLSILGKRAKRGKTVKETHDEADVLACIAEGIHPEYPGVGAVKLMVNYAPKIDAFIRGGEAVGPQKAIQNVIDWAYQRFERVNLVALIRRNALDQAISRAMATTTSVWHREEGQVPDGGDPYASSDVSAKLLNMSILRNLPGVLTHNEIIRTVAKRNSGRCLLIEYDDLAADVRATSARLVEHARKAGFTPVGEVAERSLRKLIDADRTEAIRADFSRFLKKRVGM